MLLPSLKRREVDRKTNKARLTFVSARRALNNKQSIKEKQSIVSSVQI